MKHEQLLVLAAAMVARSSPTTWSSLIGALRAYSDATTMECIQSPPDQLMRNQGRAQNAAHLLKLLENCVQAADRLEKKK